MSQNAMVERKLTELIPALRNRYYYGKLMDVLHFSMEQQYVLAKEWLYNRSVLGSGIVCGLGVDPITTSAGNGVIVRSGLAIDGWGREIIVPNDVPLVPLALTDQCGAPVQQQPGQQLPSKVMVQVCYDECSSDFAPAMVNEDCGCGDRCESGTVVESYCLRVLAGSGPAVTLPCLDAVKKALSAGDVHAALCGLSKTCTPDPDDPCLTLANVAVGANGALTIDDCTPRAIAPTNLMLVQLLACLADCCKSGPLQVTNVTVKSTSSVQPRAKPDDPTLQPVPGGVLNPPPNNILVKSQPLPDIVEFTFNSTVKQDTVSLGPPAAAASVQLRPFVKTDQKVFLAGVSNVLRIYRRQGFRGNNVISLIGGPDGPGPAPNTITAEDGTRLDGENPTTGGPGWHSGEGTQGGNFTLELNVPQ